MKTIHKFHLNLKEGEIQVQMPEGAIILHANQQHGTHYIWAQVDTRRPMVTRLFRVYGTGHEMPEPSPRSMLRFIGTVMSPNGLFVWHIFEQVSLPMPVLMSDR